MNATDTGTENINIIARSKISKITAVAVATEDDTIGTVMSKGAIFGTFLLKLLHTPKGQDWYRILRIQKQTPTISYNKSSNSS